MTKQQKHKSNITIQDEITTTQQNKALIKHDNNNNNKTK